MQELATAVLQQLSHARRRPRHADVPPRAHCQAFFAWYNNEHRHSGIGYMTPHSVHSGLAPALHTTRQVALDVAFKAHPNRFKNRRPSPHPLPTAAWINPPTRETIHSQPAQPFHAPN
jgi:putative transposase